MNSEDDSKDQVIITLFLVHVIFSSVNDSFLTTIFNLKSTSFSILISGVKPLRTGKINISSLIDDVSQN